MIARALEVVVVALLYFAAAKLGFMVHSVGGFVTLVWPATAVGLAAVMLRGKWCAIGVGLGAFAFTAQAHGVGTGPIVVGTVDALEALAIAVLLRDVAKIHLALDRPRDVLALVAASLLITLVSASISVGWLSAFGSVPGERFGEIWRAWWWGHLSGDLILVPLAITWSTKQSATARGGAHVVEAFALCVAVLVIGGFVLLRWMPEWLPGSREHYLFPLLLWTGLRFGPRGASLVNFTISVLAIAVTADRRGPFAGLSDLQGFLWISLVTTLLLSALGAERLHAITRQEAAEQAQREANEHLEQKVRDRTSQLKRRDDQLREAQALAHLGSFEHDLGPDRLDWSEELYRIFGRDPGAFVPTPDNAISCFHADDRPLVARKHALARVDGRPFSYEARIVRPGGELRTLQCDAKVHCDSALQPIAITGCCQDITERKRADEARYRLAELVESSEDAIIQISLDGVIESWNNGAVHIFGYPAAEVIGRSVLMLVPDSHAEDLALRLQLVRRGQNKFTHYEQPHRRQDGSIFDASVTTSAITDRDGHVIGMSKVLRDITAQKAADDRLRQSLREKDALLREIHHRVKNNLQLISSLLNLQLASLPSDESRHSLVESQSRIHSMALVHQLLYQSQDLAGIDIHQYLKALVDRLVKTYRIDIDHIEAVVVAPDIELDIDRAIPCGLIVNELVTNSLTHAFRGRDRGRVEVRLSRAAGRGVLEVHDDGVGIAEDIDFESVHTFGLRIARILTAQLGGTIKLVRGQGTSICIDFPLSAEPAKAVSLPRRAARS